MKRALKGLMTLAVCSSLMLAFPVEASVFQIPETDMSVEIDDSMWYVFTRDNIENNAELEELGVSYEYMDEFFQNNSAYLNGILLDEEGDYIELFVRKSSTDEVVNLSNFDDDEVMTLAEELAKQKDAAEYDVYNGICKFAWMEYVEQGVYINEYVTVANGEIYTLTFQSPEEWEDWKYEHSRYVVDSVEFRINPELKEKKFSDAGLGKTILGGALKGAIIGGVGGGIGMLLKRKKKTDEETDENF